MKNKTTKIWLSVGSFALAQVGPGLLVEKNSLWNLKGLSSLAWAGESGEGEAGGGAEAASDDGAYLTQLGLFQGHLLIGLDLYRAGDQKSAAAHLAHPLHELWENLEIALEARHAPEFDDEVKQLITQAQSGAPIPVLEETYQLIEKKMAAARTSISSDPALQIKVLANLVRAAGNEYSAGVKDGVLTELPEYQDAYGFIKAASLLLKQMRATDRAKAGAVYDAVQKELDDLNPLWPNLMITSGAKLGDPSLLYAAAARIELKASSIK